jgi:hypothetical protein
MACELTHYSRERPPSERQTTAKNKFARKKRELLTFSDPKKRLGL